MDVYLVKPGDTLYHIASQYHTSMAQLIQDNDLSHPDQLVVGRALVIRQPEQTRSVRPGENLRAITSEEALSLGALLRQNLNLCGKERIVPGQSLVLRYQNRESRRPITLLGSTPASGRQEILPFLTSPLSLPYRVTAQGTLVPPIRQSITYDGQYDESKPLLTICNRSDQEENSRQLLHKLLNHRQVRETFIDQMKEALNEADSQGILISFFSLDPEDAHAYVQFIENLRHTLPSDMTLIATLPDRAFGPQTDGGFLCGQIAQAADMVLVTHDRLNRRVPGPLSSVTDLESLLKQVLIQVPPEKCILELSDTGCDWSLPFRPDVVPTVVSSSEAVELARNHHAAIRRSRTGEGPWFRYTDDLGREHQVYFQDPASLLPQLTVVKEYGLCGLSFPHSESPAAETLVLLDSMFHIRETFKNKTCSALDFPPEL